MTEEHKEEQKQAQEASAEAEKEAFDPEKATKEEWQELLARKDEEIKEMQDRMMRAVSEAENTRKRLERERREAVCFANENLLRSILPVLDNLERAVQHSEQSPSPKTLLEGIRMTHKGFVDTLNRFGCVPFESVGKPFDPNYHEAVLQEENADHPENTVVQELEKGYSLNERLLRPAKVVVSKAPAASAGKGDAEKPSEAPDKDESPPENKGGKKIHISTGESGKDKDKEN